MPVHCPQCKVERLSEEFVFASYSETCAHPPSWCLKCASAHLKKTPTCPECKGGAADPEIVQSIHNLASRFFPAPKSLAGPSGALLVQPSDKSLAGVVQVTLLNGERYPVDYTGGTPASAFYSAVSAVTKMEQGRIRLMYQKNLIKNASDMTLSSYGVEPNCIVQLIFQMLSEDEVVDLLAFDLAWTFPVAGPDYLDGTCLVYSGATQVGLLDFNHKSAAFLSDAQSITHSGDRCTTTGCTHQITIFTKRIPPHIDRLFFTLSAWNSPDISAYRNPNVVLRNGQTNAPISSYEIHRANTHQAVIMACLFRSPGRGWRVIALELFSRGNAQAYGEITQTIAACITNQQLWM